MPESLTADCFITPLEAIETYDDAYVVAKKKDAEQQECNQRLKDIRQWSDSSPK